jgi:membrane protein
MPQLERTGHPRASGWGATLKRTLREFSDDNLADWAAALTYYAVLSVFPALIALVSLVGIFGDPQSTTRTLTKIVSQLGPSTAVSTFQGPIQSITSHRSASGIAFLAGLVLALWSASGYVGAFIRASNVIYEVDEGRPVWKLRPLQMLVTLVIIVLVAIGALAVIATGPLAHAIGSAVGVGGSAVTVFGIVKWPLLVVLVALMLSVLYYAAPNARLPGFKFVTPGGLLAVVLWVLASALFALYVANFGSYDKTYGSLGGVVVFLLWLWITNVAILLGAELNAERERSRQIDAGEPGAEMELQLPERDAPKEEKRPRSA